LYPKTIIAFFRTVSKFLFLKKILAVDRAIEMPGRRIMRLGPRFLQNATFPERQGSIEFAVFENTGKQEREKFTFLYI
jgi:hypothetical protein